MAAKPPFVLVHGAWHGGWCWARVAPLLRAAGHAVFTPTLTGLGERRHLISRDITIATFTLDLMNVIEMEELSDIVLVGHSFAGLPVSGVADRMPERLRHLVYLDSLLVQPGQSPFDGLSPAVVAARRRAAQETSGGLSLPVPPAEAMGITQPADAAWITRRMTPHPISAHESKLELTHALGNGLARTYVDCTAPRYATLDGVKARIKGQPGWGWRDLATGHDAMVSAPEALAAMLLEIAAA